MIPNSDLQKWQQAIKSIEAAQSELSPDELLAFRALTEFYDNGNFESVESSANIQVLKKNIQQHAKNRLLKAYLTNFVMLCEKYFKPKQIIVAPPIFEPPTIQPPIEVTATPKPQIEIPVVTQPQGATQEPEVKIPVFEPFLPPEPPISENNEVKAKEKRNTMNPILIIAAIAVLIGGWWVYNNWESESVLKVRNMFGLAPSVPADTTKIVPIDTAKQIAGQATAPDTISMIDTTEITPEDSEEVTNGKESVQEEPSNPIPVQRTKTYSFGKYSGALKNSIPEGEGTMVYTHNTQIAKHASNPYFAESGDVFIGTWGNGDIVSGKLFDKDKNLKATILAGKRPNPYDISKD